MTKRISQANTVVVPVVPAHGVDGKVVAEKAVVVPADAEAVVAKTDVKADEAPATVVAEVAALVAPAPMAMVAAQDAATQTTDTTTSTTTPPATDDTGSGQDLTPYIVGGVLLGGGILAIALSSGDDNNSTPTPTPGPTPTPTPTNAVTFSSGTTATIAENAAATTTVIDVNATAAGTGGPITYALGGTDAALFNIDTATGIVTLKSSANFEAKASYSITVTATSAANGTTPSATATTPPITVTVTNVNEAPTFGSPTQTVSFAENGTGAVVAAGGASDPDANTTLVYTLTGTDAALFNVSSTGAVTFKAAPDFESTAHGPAYTFNLVASDGATPALTTSQAVTVNVTNVNEAPVFTSGATASVNENVAAGTTVYTAVSTDPEGTARTYTLSGTDAAAFTINATTGVVTINASPDFETKASYSFTVNASDGTNTTARPVTLSINDIAVEGPPQVTTSLDTNATASGLGDAGAAQATTFTDGAGVGNNSTIANFGSDDQIVFSGTTSVSFSSNGNDLLIQFSNAAGTIASDIRISNVVTPNDVVTNEANANAALNAHFGTQAQNIDFFKFA